MATYFGTSINDSPTIVLPAGEDIKDARGIALTIKDGAVIKPEAGAHAIGISLIETDETKVWMLIFKLRILANGLQVKRLL